MKAVILAAGESSRFKPVSDNQHKGLTEVLGCPIIEHTIEELRTAGVDEIIVVQSPSQEIEKRISSADHFVVQEEPKGMGDALRQAEHLLDDKFLVLTPYRANAAQFFEPMIEKAEEDSSDIVFLSTPTDEPTKYGILELNDEGKAIDMIEKPDSEEAPSNNRIVGMYLLDEKFFDYLDDCETWEYQYEDALSKHMKDQPASVLKIEDKTNSIKYPWDLFSVVEELMEDRGENISKDAEIADSAEIKGDVVVEDGVRIYENATIKGPAYIGENSVVGNNTLIRDHVALEKNVSIGANTEIKKSVFQPNSSIHSGYIGDSIIGRNTKIGAGTITANRKFRKNGERPEIKSDLIEKNHKKSTNRGYMGAIIGDNVDIGINVSIMPGIQIGSDAKIGPGTVVTENIDSEETVYVDQQQVRKK